MEPQQAAKAAPSVPLPLLLLTIGFTLLVAFQTIELIRDRGRITETRAGQETAIQDGAKVRQQLEGIAQKTAALADAGNVNAKAIVEQLKREGVTFKAGP